MERIEEEQKAAEAERNAQANAQGWEPAGAEAAAPAGIQAYDQGMAPPQDAQYVQPNADASLAGFQQQPGGFAPAPAGFQQPPQNW